MCSIAHNLPAKHFFAWPFLVAQYSPSVTCTPLLGCAISADVYVFLVLNSPRAKSTKRSVLRWRPSGTFVIVKTHERYMTVANVQTIINSQPGIKHKAEQQLSLMKYDRIVIYEYNYRKI